MSRPFDPARETYVSLATFRRDGREVRTAVTRRRPATEELSALEQGPPPRVTAVARTFPEDDATLPDVLGLIGSYAASDRHLLVRPVSPRCVGETSSHGGPARGRNRRSHQATA